MKDMTDKNYLSFPVFKYIFVNSPAITLNPHKNRKTTLIFLSPYFHAKVSL